MLYIGSCRYMTGYRWDYFPARLHSTREIIFFLEQITAIEEVLNAHTCDLTNCIFGDIHHDIVKSAALRFISKKINRDIKAVVLEISSRKVMYYNVTPLNYYYAVRDNLDKGYTLVPKILTDEEVEYDVWRIIELCKNVFNEQIQIHVIPHLNLKSRVTNDYISERAALVHLLERASTKYTIVVHNIGRYIENRGGECFLEDYMPDGAHYEKDCYTTIKAFLIQVIYSRASVL